jgi:hypothetical protein
MSKRVADLLVETLQSAGVKTCYGIVGDTLNRIAHAEAELAIIEDDDLDRQVLLHRGQQIAEQRGEPAVTGHTDHLPAGLALLQPDRRWHSAGASATRRRSLACR